MPSPKLGTNKVCELNSDCVKTEYSCLVKCFLAVSPYSLRSFDLNVMLFSPPPPPSLTRESQCENLPPEEAWLETSHFNDRS